MHASSVGQRRRDVMGSIHVQIAEVAPQPASTLREEAIGQHLENYVMGDKATQRL
jgi:hypothetical protein